MPKREAERVGDEALEEWKEKMRSRMGPQEAGTDMNPDGASGVSENMRGSGHGVSENMTPADDD